ncbi:MAG: transketolase family protein [bacterium]
MDKDILEKINNPKLSYPRVAYGKTLAELGEQNDKIVAVDADLAKSTKTAYFQEKFPHRFFDMGISEADMVTTAAGISSCGFTVFASTFSIFLTGRAWEQIRNTVAYGNFNVKLVATHAGITVGPDGASHQALEDIALISAIPNMKIMAGGDYLSTVNLVKLIAEQKGPFYLRLPRCKAVELYSDTDKFYLGGSQQLSSGNDITIISYGLMLQRSLSAAQELNKQGIKARVIDMYSIKPFDYDAVLSAAGETKGIVVAEEHTIKGGLGSQIATFLSQHQPTKIKYVSMKDEFGRSGEPQELLDHYQLTSNSIVEKSLEIIND